jgi:hypothetical protein
MFPHRTRTHPLRARFAGMACALSLLAVPVAGAVEGGAPDLTLTIEQLPLSSGRDVARVAIHGQAPLNCAPAIGRTWLDDADFSVELRSPTQGCDPLRQQPFTLRVDPRASGLPLPANRVLRVRAYRTHGATPVLAAFRLFDTGPATAAQVPENGFWWSTADAGSGEAVRATGASLEWQDGELAVALYGFTETGAPTWYFGSARPGGRVARVGLVQLAGGEPLLASSGGPPQALPGPRLEIEFLSPTQARAWLVRVEDGRDVQLRPMLLSRARFASDDGGATWSGRWVLVPDDGQPRTFEFRGGSRGAENFQLNDPANDARLDCRVPVAGGLPDLCTLSVGGQPAADFDRIGFDRLGGRGSSGAPVTLVRVQH